MDGDRKAEAEFTIDRGAEKDRGTSTSSPRGASNVPPRERAEQAAFDLGAKGQREADGGMPERLRRKYYVAEADVGAEAKVYADPKGEYLAFKVTTERMATRLEDSGVIRDMVSIAQHRSWKEVEIRGSEEFRRTAWLEASARGISVRGYEPDPVDRAALAFRAKTENRSTRAPSQPRQTEAEASETISVAGVSTKRPIQMTVVPPEPSAKIGRQSEDGPAPFQGPGRPDRASSWQTRFAGEQPPDRPAMTIDVVPSETSRQSTRKAGQDRAEMFRLGDRRQNERDDAVRAARSQLAAIKRALTKAVRDPELRRSVLAHAKERIAEQLERGGEFKHAELQERPMQRQPSEESRASPKGQHHSNAAEVHRER